MLRFLIKTCTVVGLIMVGIVEIIGRLGCCRPCVSVIKVVLRSEDSLRPTCWVGLKYDCY